ncbi:MAG: hypothetical protein ACC608_06600 [Anaerofustis sp.]
MDLNFTIAVAPNATNIQNEMKHIKCALLYADKITLISPFAAIIYQITDKSNQNDEKHILQLLLKIMKLSKSSNPSFYKENIQFFQSALDQVKQKAYQNIPTMERLKFRHDLIEQLKTMNATLFEYVGEKDCSDLTKLIKNNQVIIQNFNHTLDDPDGCSMEYYESLIKSLDNSYPIFDELSSNLMKYSVQDKYIVLDDMNGSKIKHAGLVKNHIVRLPSFESASIDELLDIKNELSKPLIRYRSQMQKYSNTIKSLPWDKDFVQECEILYRNEIEPELLNIDEAINDNTFLKNLGYSFMCDANTFKSMGGLFIGITTATVLSSFCDTLSTESAAIMASTSWIVPKIVSTYKDYTEKKKQIERNNLFFYYQANKLMNQMI